MRPEAVNYELPTHDSAFSRRPNCRHARRTLLYWSRPISRRSNSSPGISVVIGATLCQDDDKTENELSVKCGFRLMSSYQVTDTERLWIITEADRSVTTPVLLPTEY